MRLQFYMRWMSRQVWLRSLNKDLREARERTIQKSVLMRGSSVCKGPEVGHFTCV